jgi:soluble lytic murein transglycosylase-like protein
MLYTRFVIGDETESSTIAFNLSQFAGVSTTSNRTFWILLMGINGSDVMWTLPPVPGEHQAASRPGAVLSRPFSTAIRYAIQRSDILGILRQEINRTTSKAGNE